MRPFQKRRARLNTRHARASRSPSARNPHHDPAKNTAATVNASDVLTISAPMMLTIITKPMGDPSQYAHIIGFHNPEGSGSHASAGTLRPSATDKLSYAAGSATRSQSHLDDIAAATDAHHARGRRRNRTHRERDVADLGTRYQGHARSGRSRTIEHRTYPAEGAQLPAGVVKNDAAPAMKAMTQIARNTYCAIRPI